MSKFIVVLLFIGWSAGSTWYYTCEIKGLCEPNSEEQVEKPKETAPPLEKPTALSTSIGYKLNDLKGQKGPGWNLLKDSLLQIVSTGDNSLLIIGRYFTGEKAPAGFRNMGLARAQSLKDELANDSNKDLLSISSEFMGDRPKGYWNQSMEFRTEKVDNSQAKVVENEDGITIYFPSGSADALISESLVNKLNRISKELISTQGGANIIGHTDNTGDRKSNHALGQKRARMIEKLFIDNGVNTENLRASSMGDTQPASDNSTAEGRALNRRIEITFNDNK